MGSRSCAERRAAHPPRRDDAGRGEGRLAGSCGVAALAPNAGAGDLLSRGCARVCACNATAGLPLSARALALPSPRLAGERSCVRRRGTATLASLAGLGHIRARPRVGSSSARGRDRRAAHACAPRRSLAPNHTPSHRLLLPRCCGRAAAASGHACVRRRASSRPSPQQPHTHRARRLVLADRGRAPVLVLGAC
eukprot:Amastigsp_a511733_9.p3 type:complete len:194 gc:universal Amastigsp_a511733_9:1-582(+)